MTARQTSRAGTKVELSDPVVPKKGVRALADDQVDRPEAEVQQWMELTGTNRPRS